MPRGRRGPPRRKKLAEAGKVVELTVDRLGAQADGVARHDGKTIYVAGALPGEAVTARIVDRRGDGLVAALEAVTDTSPQRIAPVCPHYGTCGGCALQHLTPDAVAEWRRDQVAQALARRALDVPLEVRTPDIATRRRRARFALAVERDGGVRVGFHGRRQRQVIVIDTCPQVGPRLLAAAQAVAAALSGHVGRRGPVDVVATLTDNGVDLLLVGPADLSAQARLALAGCTGDGDIARLSWQPDDNASWEPLAVHRAPMVTFDGVAVDVPPGGFLQPTAAGEACLAGIVITAVAGARRVVDLFAGLGTFSLPLSSGANVAAFEGDATLVAALKQAAGRAGRGGRLSAHVRDLERQPLPPKEFAKADAVVLDPPRTGAPAQCHALADAGVPLIAMVSCHPATFARDARTLADGGYTLERVSVVDQFGWSHHTELVGVFRR